ncbi:MAG: glycosyltransferase [Gammaproteobacteria bacterium]|nr:MAG: glycosyltransferase [Gammaproteobacteria bacterium]
MRILYGVQGTGNGHITRARAMQRAFATRHVQVDYLLSGRDRDAFFDMDCFGDYQHRHGLTFAVSNGRIDITRTIRQLKARQFLRDVRELDLSAYDVILTDFEPVTAWAGRLAGKTVIGAGHQYAFQYRIPKAGNHPLASAIMRHFAPADIALGFHWHHFNQPVLPPLLEPHTPCPPNHSVVVYLPFEDTRHVCECLAMFPLQSFDVFSPQPIPSEWPNIRVHPLSRHGFQTTLAGCEGVICNTGFELISEALQSGKKILGKPLHGQMEQLSNARALQMLGLAQIMPTLDRESIHTWLSASAQPRQHYPDVANAVADWIVSGDWHDPGRLAHQLWQQIGPDAPDTLPIPAV